MKWQSVTKKQESDKERTNFHETYLSEFKEI